MDEATLAGIDVIEAGLRRAHYAVFSADEGTYCDADEQDWPCPTWVAWSRHKANMRALSAALDEQRFACALAESRLAALRADLAGWLAKAEPYPERNGNLSAELRALAAAPSGEPNTKENR